MDDFASDTDSDYTSYWRDWVSAKCLIPSGFTRFLLCGMLRARDIHYLLRCKACFDFVVLNGARMLSAGERCLLLMFISSCPFIFFRVLVEPLDMALNMPQRVWAELQLYAEELTLLNMRDSMCTSGDAQELSDPSVSSGEEDLICDWTEEVNEATCVGSIS